MGQYAIRRAYFAARAAAMGEPFSRAGLRSPPHIGHCFDYLQQSLRCNADRSIEPFFGAHFADIHFTRQCRDFEGVKAFAEQWRVVDGRGFNFDIHGARNGTELGST